MLGRLPLSRPQDPFTRRQKQLRKDKGIVKKSSCSSPVCSENANVVWYANASLQSKASRMILVGFHPLKL